MRGFYLFAYHVADGWVGRFTRAFAPLAAPTLRHCSIGSVRDMVAAGTIGSTGIDKRATERGIASWSGRNCLILILSILTTERDY